MNDETHLVQKFIDQAEIIIKEGTQQFGTYTLYDKGIYEIADPDPWLEMIAKLSPGTTGDIFAGVVKLEHGKEFVEGCLMGLFQSIVDDQYWTDMMHNHSEVEELY